LTKEEIEKERKRQKRILKEKYPGEIIPPRDEKT